MTNQEIAQEINNRIGNSPVPFDSVYSIALEIYQELGGEESQFDSVYSILLETLNVIGSGISAKVIDDSSISLTKTWSSSKIASELADAGFNVEIVTELPSVGDPHTIYFILKSDSSTGDYYDEWMYIDGNWEKVGNTQIDLSDYATIDYVDEKIEAVIGAANSEIEGKQTEDFAFVQTLPTSGEEDEQVIIKGDNTDTLYKYVSGAWVEQTPDANKLYFDVENEALYSYVTAQHQFAPVSLVNTIVVGSNLNNNADLKALKTPGVYSVVQRLHNATKGDYVKNWTLYVESVDYEEYDRSDSIYQRLVSNYTIQKRTWSATRATNDGWSSFSTYYTGEIKDSTVSKYYTWSSSKLNASLGAKQDVLNASNGIAIDASNNISIEGIQIINDPSTYKYNFATYYYDDDTNQLGVNTANGGYSNWAEGSKTTATSVYGGNHAEGYGSSATGEYAAHAEGCFTTASGEVSHAEGFKTTASGDYGSHTEGCFTVASGQSAHAEGWGGSVYKNVASGGGSHAEGCGTTAQNMSEHAEGSNNLSHKASDTFGNAGNTLHSIGDSDLMNVKHNAFEIMQNADMYIKGVGGYQGTDTKVQNASIMTVQEVIANKADVYEVATIAEIEALFAAPEPEPIGPASNEIWYTSYQNQVVTPTNTEGLPAIVSNTNIDGRGKIVFASQITSLPEFMFDSTGIQTIMLPDTITTLGEGAFGTSSIETFICPENVTVIPMSIFQNSTELEYVELPAGITSIGNFAFSVSQYGHLASITYKGTVAQWNAITKDTYWKQGATVLTVVHCSDGDVNL